MTSLHYPGISFTSKGLPYRENSSAGSSAKSRKRYRGSFNIFGALRIRRQRLLPFLRQVVKGAGYALHDEGRPGWETGDERCAGGRELEHRRGASVYGRRDEQRVGRRVLRWLVR